MVPKVLYNFFGFRLEIFTAQRIIKTNRDSFYISGKLASALLAHSTP